MQTEGRSLPDSGVFGGSLVARGGTDSREAALSGLKLVLERAREQQRTGYLPGLERAVQEAITTLDAAHAGAADAGCDHAECALAEAAAWAALGRVREARGAGELAVRDFARAAALYGEWIPRLQKPAGAHRADLAVVLDRLGRREDALPLLREAVTAGTATWEVYQRLGLALMQADSGEAGAFLIQAVERNAEDAISLEAIGDLLADRDRVHRIELAVDIGVNQQLRAVVVVRLHGRGHSSSRTASISR